MRHARESRRSRETDGKRGESDGKRENDKSRFSIQVLLPVAPVLCR